MHHYYLVYRGSKTHNTIAEAFAKCIEGTKARWKLIGKLFPESKQKDSGWRLVTWSSSRHWGIQPRYKTGTTTLPDDWKFMKRSSTIIPRHSTKAGKELHKLMESDKYCVPSAGDIGLDIGIKSVFDGLSLCTPGFIAIPDGRYVIEVSPKMEIAAGTKRISDIEFEKLQIKKPAKS